MDPGNRIQHHAGRSPSDTRLGASQSRLDRERGGLQDERLQGRNGLDRWPDRFEQQGLCIAQHFTELSEIVERKLRNEES